MSHQLFLLILLMIIPLCVHSQNNAVDKLKLYKTESTITIDGLLDEPVWEKALYTDKFYGKEDSSLYYDNTKVYFTYDAKNLYVAFESEMKDPSLLPDKELNKDDERILENEWIAFSIDTYNDGINAFTFIVDAAGNQLDGSLNPNKYLTYSFSTNWTSAVQRESDEYTVEMKIPLADLPIQWNENSVKMSMLMIRLDSQHDREIQYPFLDKGSISEFQEIKLEGIDKTNPPNLSGVDVSERLAYKKSRIDLTTLEGRTMGGDASVMDYLIFKKREIEGADRPRTFPYNLQPELVGKTFKNTTYFKKHFPMNYDFETFLERTQTSAFLVLKNDTIIYENYFNGFNRDSVFTSFSVAKSFVSILIGLAINEGYIKSDTDKITTYLPELLKKDTRFSNITIKDLLSMSSGLAYSEEGYPSDGDFTYYAPDLRQATLENLRIAEAPGKKWLYNNYNTLLLGLILERTTQMPVSKYLEQKLWKKMGGGNASWSLDEHSYEKMESGINSNIYDYARFAELVLHGGRYNNTQVVPETWMQKSTQPQNRPAGYYDMLLDNNIYYSYFWWGKFRGGQQNKNDLFAQGNKGQYIYISPRKHLIIIKMGFEYGLTTPAAYSWPELFYQFATDYKATNKEN